jgi:hypothetical protein
MNLKIILIIMVFMLFLLESERYIKPNYQDIKTFIFVLMVLSEENLSTQQMRKEKWQSKFNYIVIYPLLT